MDDLFCDMFRCCLHEIVRVADESEDFSNEARNSAGLLNEIFLLRACPERRREGSVWILIAPADARCARSGRHGCRDVAWLYHCHSQIQIVGHSFTPESFRELSDEAFRCRVSSCPWKCRVCRDRCNIADSWALCL